MPVQVPDRGVVAGRVVLAVLLLVWSGAPAFPVAIDDLYITAAYAHEWLRTGHLQWSSGEIVEGTTSLGWVVALLPGAALGVDLGVWSRAMSFLCAVAFLVAWSVLAPRDRATTWTIAITAGWSGFASSAMLGFEAMTFAGLLALGWTALLLQRRRWALGLLLAASAFRPEGWALVALAVLDGVRERGPRRMRAELAVAITAAGCWWLGRWAYFGALLPTPFLVKVVGPTIPRAYGVVHLAMDLAIAAGPLVAIAMFRRAPKRWWLALAPLALHAALLLAIRGDWFGFGRFLLPGLLATIVAWTVAGERRSPTRWWAVAGLAAVPSFALVPTAGGALVHRGPGDLVRTWTNATRPWEAYLSGLSTPLPSDTAWLVERLPPDWTFLTYDVGLPGNIVRVRVRDQAGLVDRAFADANAGLARSPLERRGLFGPPPKPIQAWRAFVSGNPLWTAPHLDLHRPDLTLVATRPGSGEGAGTYEYLAVSHETPSSDVITERWRALAERYPSQPWIVWRWARHLAERGEADRAVAEVRRRSWRWPLHPLATEPEAAVSFSDARDVWPEYVWTRGYALRSSGVVASRPIANGTSVALYVDADGTGSRVLVGWQACGPLAWAEIPVDGPVAWRLGAPPCAQAARVAVWFTNDGGDGAADRNVFVSLRPARTDDRPLPAPSRHDLPFASDPPATWTARGWGMWWNGAWTTPRLPAGSVVDLRFEVDAPGDEGARIALAWDPPCGTSEDDVVLRGPETVRVVAPCAASLRARFTNDRSVPEDRNVYVRAALGE